MFQFEVEDAPEERVDGGDGDANAPPSFKVGERIVVEGAWGVVRYVGEVGGYAGSWLGVEWDDPERGKHDGQVGGVAYFTSPSPRGASFVRAHKATRAISTTFLEALRERYDPKDLLPNVKSIEDRLQRKAVDYADLRVINLGGRGVRELDGWEEVHQLCPNVEVVEISDNFFKEWEPLLKLFRGWPRLRRFDLSRNPLRPVTLEEVELLESSTPDSFPSLEIVVLGSVAYEWEDLVALSHLWPRISQLTVPFNKMAVLSEPPTNILFNITSIDLEKNGINEWTEVLKLNCLNKLEYLNLCGNHISKIYFPTMNTGASYFSTLGRLNITENFIAEWSSVSELNKLKNLKELRMDVNPVLNHHDRPTNRQLVIARIEGLQKLEGVEIHRQERRDAELDYVKMYSKEWADVGNRAEFLRGNPLYPQLVEKHGLSDSRERGGDTHSMKSTLLNLVIVPESSLKYKECEKKILKTMSVSKLKALLQRTFKLPNVPVYITATSCRNPEISFELDNDFIDVGQYSLEDGDTLRLRW